MSDTKSNFFHPGHPIQEIKYPDLSKGFNESNRFVHHRGESLKLKVDYTDVPNNPDAPIALIFSGLSTGFTKNNSNIVADILKCAGIATAKIGFAGCTHIKFRNPHPINDLVTPSSKIEDLNSVIEAIGEERKIFMVVDKAGLDIAVPVASQRNLPVIDFTKPCLPLLDRRFASSEFDVTPQRAQGGSYNLGLNLVAYFLNAEQTELSPSDQRLFQACVERVKASFQGSTSTQEIVHLHRD